MTRYDIYTFPLNEIWYEVLSYPVDQAPQVLEALAQWQLDCGSSDFKSNVVFEISLDSITLGVVYAGPQARQPECFAPFYKLDSFTVSIPSTNGTFTSLNKIADSIISHDRMRYVQPFIPPPVFESV